MSDDLTCPFCSEGDFDAVGLKIHLTAGYCDAYNRVSVDVPKTRPAPADGIDWSHVPEGFDWVAMDADGLGYGFNVKPTINECGWWEGDGKTDARCTGECPDFYLPPSQWRESLRRRNPA